MTRDERLITSVNEEEKQAVRMEAARRGITMSEFVRNAVLGEVECGGSAGNPNPTVANSD